MNLNVNRSFNCKDEELSVLCGFGSLSLARDLSDFAAYSPLFDASYLSAFKARMEALKELILPKSETIELKVITGRLYRTMDELKSPINHLKGYLELSGKLIPITAGDFGLVALSKSARAHDVEGVLSHLHSVEANIKKYQNELMAKGLTEALIEKFTAAAILLAADKNKKYALVSSRAAIVQNNLGLLNDLHNQLTEICRIGKILYKPTNPAKLKDYTFSHLMKQVKLSKKPVADILPA
jgi:hypothetical protein